jgi:2-phospho-L-lactate guanylyltransferase
MPAMPASPQPAPATIVIVPVGTLEGSKSRLGGTLDAEERRDLAERLLRATVASAVAARGVTEVLVVTPDDTVREIALEVGARPLRQRGSGLNEGLREARDEAVAAGAAAVVVLPIDLPAVSPSAVEAVVEAVADDASGHPIVVLVPDRHGRGTNALAMRPPDAIDFCFGGDSRFAHGSCARAAGARLVELDGPLRLDLDTPEDLLLAEGQEPDVLVGRDAIAPGAPGR